ncbi:D-tagatose 3-epimerase [Peptococcaceae bacterium CEB3]|nr:D-tagatose 3-epimerase [Peptococcaceae bacterium CEB3]
MNKVGIYFAYWTRDWSANYLYYLNKVADLGFDVLEVAFAHILAMSGYERAELRKAALDEHFRDFSMD